MKFAVIEYTSKSGDIWRHQPDHPNYLADPLHEIDPTSFGCYVSALAGEHIPLTKLINTGSLPHRIYRKITGHWPQHYSLEYLKDFDALLIVHDMHREQEMVRFIKRLKGQYPHITRIGVPTQPFGILKDHWKQDQQAAGNISEFMAACHAFLTVVASTKDAWQSKSTQPVHYLPQPYPVEHASQGFKPRTRKQPIIFVAGVTDRDNITKGHTVAQQLLVKFPDYAIHVTDTPGYELTINSEHKVAPTIQPFRPWQDQLEYLSEVTLVINTDYTQTRGRVQVDCAAVGTPSIGADSDGQLDLFPDLPGARSDPVEQLVDQAAKLLQDDNFYQRVTTTARQRLDKYNYEHSAARLNNLIKTYQP